MAARVLVIDDHPNLVELIKIRLESIGMTVIPALDGQEGLAMARKENPDLIILDVMLPKMNGFKICRLLKFDRKYKHIPIVMLSSRAKQSDAAMGLHTGADAYLFKPYDPKKLIRVIRDLLKKKTETAPQKRQGKTLETFAETHGFSLPEPN